MEDGNQTMSEAPLSRRRSSAGSGSAFRTHQFILRGGFRG